jgi:hypothetical protein
MESRRIPKSMALRNRLDRGAIDRCDPAAPWSQRIIGYLLPGLTKYDEGSIMV